MEPGNAGDGADLGQAVATGDHRPSHPVLEALRESVNRRF